MRIPSVDFWSVFCYSPEGKQNWVFNFNIRKGIQSGILIDSSETIYFGSTDGNIYALYPDGQVKWKCTTGIISEIAIPNIDLKGKLPLNDKQIDNTGAIGEDGTLYLGLHITSLNSQQKRTVLAIKDSGTSDLEQSNSKISYCLYQNYPNPFNPATYISYSIPIESFIELKIFDMLGREVSTLVSREQSAGRYNVKFDASSLPSGVYIYTIQAGGFRESRKLLLLK